MPQNANTEALELSNVAIQKFMPVMDMETALRRRDILVQATRKLMREGVDYGVIPGTAKPTLLQPGADKLCNLFGLVIKYEIVESIKDWNGSQHGLEPFFYFEVRGRAWRDDMLLGEGIGSCSSLESRYRWRFSERRCPSCGSTNIRKGKNCGWYCWKKTGGCGATFADGDPAIESQTPGRVRNPDIYDVVNTVEKMAFKRAKIAAVINAVSASEFFTQDMEDTVDSDLSPSHEVPVPPPPEPPADLEGRTNSGQKPWKTFKEMLAKFDAMRAAINRAGGSDADYYDALDRFGVKHANEFKDTSKALQCYRLLEERVNAYERGGDLDANANA